MNNNQRTINRRFALVSFFTICAMLMTSLFIFTACQQPFSAISSGEEGNGWFSLAGGSSRTIMPDTVQDDFQAYTLSFTGAVAQTVNRTNENLYDPVELPAGNYSLTVTAFMDAARNQPAATGTITFSIASMQRYSHSVDLLPIIEGGKGTFTWNIEYPADVNYAKMTITPFSGGTAETIDLIGNKAGSKNDLNSGHYRVEFKLKKTFGHIGLGFTGRTPGNPACLSKYD